MTVSDCLPVKRLKIKFGSKNTEFVLNSGSCEMSQQLLIDEDSSQNTSCNETKESVMRKSQKAAPHSSDILKLFCGTKESVMKKSQKPTPHSSHSLKSFGDDLLKIGSPMQSLHKRGPPEFINSVGNKRQKLDRCLKRHCGGIIEALLKHPAARGFDQPVDPEKLGIPDYFSVITKPMDLGTINEKLQDDTYFSAEEFKSDVKLTLSNAIMYNPPDNMFNKNAKKLDSIFTVKWKSLEARLKHESINCEESFASCSERKPVEIMNLCPKRSLQGEFASSKYLPSEEKRKPTKEKLKTSDARHENRKPARNIQNSRCTGKVLQKVIRSGNRSTCCSVKTIASSRVAATSSCSCGSLKCQCSPQNDSGNASSKSLASERRMGQYNVASKMEQEGRLLSNTCKSDPESDGVLSVLDGDIVCSTPQPSSPCTSAAVADAWTPALDLEMSPKKALRAAMLKSRFADTILKAKQKTDHVDKVDPLKLRQEKERLEKQHEEEKARIEARIRDDELRAQERLRIRQREREAAREALEKMEKTVDFEDNKKIFEELDMFYRFMPSNHLFTGSDNSEGLLFKSNQGGGCRNILEQLGLFIKDDYMDYEDVEDGEIL